jgi:hypothetical protein
MAPEKRREIQSAGGKARWAGYAGAQPNPRSESANEKDPSPQPDSKSLPGAPDPSENQDCTDAAELARH